MNESSVLSDGAIHGDRGRIVLPGVRTGASASPIAKTVAVSRCGTNRDSRSTVSPATSGTHPATGPRRHRQEILCLEYGCVGRVSGRRDSVRDRAVVAPLLPNVLYTGITALRRSRGDGVG